MLATKEQMPLAAMIATACSTVPSRRSRPGSQVSMIPASAQGTAFSSPFSVALTQKPLTTVGSQ